uniref:Uncharacterized protein n=1 Tax=Opuntia streptacantha TaxID=393608 RepID=A0A7C9A0C8_OPUST
MVPAPVRFKMVKTGRIAPPNSYQSCFPGSVDIGKHHIRKVLRNLESSKFIKEFLDMLADFFWFFLIDEVSNSFHYDYLFQKRHISVEPTLVYVIFHVWEIVG